MKKIVQIILGCVLFNCTTQAQILSSCTGTTVFTSAYQNDATDMAVARIYALHSSDTQFIDVPTIYIDTVMNGLAAIYNTANAIEADSVYNKYCIHAFPNGFIKNHFTVTLDTTYGWTHAWMAGNTTTGNSTIDSFMSQYGFRVTGHYSLTGINMAYIQTDRAINTRRFMDSLAHFGGVYTWTNGTVAGEAPKLISYTQDTVSHYAFRIGWGDCLAGCTFSKIWYYTVNNSCAVWLDSVVLNNMHGAGGFPAADNCRLGVQDVVSGNYDVKVYPNPASGNVTLETSIHGCSYIVQDILGRLQATGKMSSVTDLDISTWTDGLYSISILFPDGTIQHHRFLKL